MSEHSVNMTFERLGPPKRPLDIQAADESRLDRFAESKTRWLLVIPIALIFACVSMYPVARMFALWPRYALVATQAPQPVAFEVTVVRADGRE